MFRRQLLASSIALVAATGVNAQTNESIKEEELVVTGIRASLTRAMDVKRDSQGVVDAISAEDIGKFPDTNLAESLQRITGVSIDRQNGEGSKITVRGLGPDFNLVTLNGRQMPGATIESASASGSRSFDFANIASEGVSGVEVFKTVRAENPTGGIGSTVNIKTARPFDKPGLNASFGVKGVYDTSADDTSITPEISALVSQTFADDTIGVGLSLSYQDREGGSNNAQIGSGWRSFQGSDHSSWGAISDDPSKHQNMPSDNDVYSVPQQVGYSFHEFQRKRLNSQLVFQIKPIDEVTATLDYTYSQNEFEDTYNDIGAWFNFGDITSRWTEGAEGGSVVSPLEYTELNATLQPGYDINTSTDADPRGSDIAMGVGLNKQKAINDSIGFNLKYEPTDSLSFEFDAHTSSAEAKPDSPYGNHNILTVASFTRTKSTLYLGQDLPILGLETMNPSGGSEIRTEDLMVSGSSFRNSYMKNDIDQLQLKGKWEFDDSLSVNFGAAYTKTENLSTYASVDRQTWGGVGQAGQLPAEFFTLDTIADKFDDVSGSGDERLFNSYMQFNFQDVRDFAAANYDDQTGTGTCADSTWYCSSNMPTDIFEVKEDTFSLFGQVTYAFEIMDDRNITVNAGLRYEDTKVESPYTVPTFDTVMWTGTTEQSLVAGSGQVSDTSKGDYDYFLPSIDVSVDVTEDVIARAALGRSLTRPNYRDIQGGVFLSRTARVNGGSGEIGNPGLLPYISDNFDLSLEWYYGESNYVSAGYFRKKVKNFIGTSVTQMYPISVANPAAGARAQAAIDSGISPTDFESIRAYIIDNRDPNDQYIQQTDSGFIIYGNPNEDPDLPFDITMKVNNKDATIDGFEFAVQHVFGETGFGGMLNFTLVDSDTGWDDMALGESQFIIPGLSDTRNLVLFYDKYGIQARLAYNWRDDFIASGNQGDVGPSPIYVEAYDQWDMNISYDINENFNVFLEGINITDEYRRTYGRSELQTLNVNQGGARYNLGARYTF